MAREEVELGVFLQELVDSIGKRLKEQEAEIGALRKEIDAIKRNMDRPGPRVDKSVLRVLKGN
jgi:hypothetical protein